MRGERRRWKKKKEKRRIQLKKTRGVTSDATDSWVLIVPLLSLRIS